MSGPLIITNVGTTATYQFVGVTFSEPEIPRGVRVAPLLAPRSMVVATADPATHRTTGSPTWNLHVAPLRDSVERLWGTRAIANLMNSWLDAQTTLKLSGPDLLDLVTAPLARETEGVYADKRFRASLGWWAAQPSIYKDGVLTASGWTADLQSGWVTFTVALGASVEVTATVARAPQGVLIGVRAVPVSGKDPAVYDVTATFREEDCV